jgi:hypothetical protein
MFCLPAYDVVTVANTRENTSQRGYRYNRVTPRNAAVMTHGRCRFGIRGTAWPMHYPIITSSNIAATDISFRCKPSRAQKRVRRWQN